MLISLGTMGVDFSLVFIDMIMEFVASGIDCFTNTLRRVGDIFSSRRSECSFDSGGID
jgi:hypothetical protein